MIHLISLHALKHAHALRKPLTGLLIIVIEALNTPDQDTVKLLEYGIENSIPSRGIKVSGKGNSMTTLLLKDSLVV